ncbi:amidohydrolase family protein [Arthrobacter zhaoguopingii]|uniref:amidohydrolase family protein n=1 Tax=Arthrobacter zhaoguopingii TaxID=2681491 RepID=UPI001356CAC3|nr:amidohydrolase family protein [Arthrobacter zhaoguopingii]
MSGGGGTDGSGARTSAPAPLWCAAAWLGDRGVVGGVRVVPAGDGTVASLEAGVAARAGDTVLPGVVFPAAANAHSHAFHRVLRGRTHNGASGSFWTWRESMYAAARQLTPELYEELATAVFAEMVVTGWSSVAEFHYVHHRPDGSPYGSGTTGTTGQTGAPAPAGSGTAGSADGPDGPHAMELALARAAVRAGIRLTLLDTCYLAGGFGRPAGPDQARFTDASANAWLRRFASLREVMAERFPASAVTVGAGLHSVRAVPPEALAEISGALPPDVPVHIHLSEQPAENEACLAATGLTPTGLLSSTGLLTSRLSAVHATHLTAADIDLLGGAGTTVVMCPTTEADLADGIGPAGGLQRAGARIALGTDQHAVIDPWIEMRALEHGERLATGGRPQFTPAELLAAGTGSGLRAQGRPPAGLEPGAVCDLVAIDPRSVRTTGSDPEQLVYSATAQDVTDVVIGGVPAAHRGRHLGLGDPADLLAAVLGKMDGGAGRSAHRSDSRTDLGAAAP